MVRIAFRWLAVALLLALVPFTFAHHKEKSMTQLAKGTFEVKLAPLTV